MINWFHRLLKTNILFALVDEITHFYAKDRWIACQSIQFTLKLL